MDEATRALLRRGRGVGYDRNIAPVFEDFGLLPPSSYAEFAIAFDDYDENLKNAIIARLRFLSGIGRPTLQFRHVEGTLVDPRSMADMLNAIRGRIQPLEIDPLKVTRYQIVAAHIVELEEEERTLVFIDVNYSEPTRFFETFEGPQIVNPVASFTLRFDEGTSNVDIVGYEPYVGPITDDLLQQTRIHWERRGDRLMLGDPLRLSRGWVLELLRRYPARVSSAAGATTDPVARRISLRADQEHDILDVTNRRLHGIEIVIGGNTTEFDVDLVRVNFTIDFRPITVHINVRTNKLMYYQYLTHEYLGIVLDALRALFAVG